MGHEHCENSSEKLNTPTNGYSYVNAFKFPVKQSFPVADVAHCATDKNDSSVKFNVHVNATPTANVPECTGLANVNVTLKCLFTNPDMLDNKMSEFETYIAHRKPMVIGIVEVKPKHCRYQPSSASYNLPGFRLFRRNIESSTGRGVILYIHNSLVASEVQIFEDYEESVWGEIALHGSDRLLIGVVYRSNSGSEENNDKLLSMFRSISSLSYSHVLLMGDFNLPGIDWSTFTTSHSTNHLEHKFIESVRDSFLIQHVNQPTRCRSDQAPSVLDLIFSSEEGMVSELSVESPLGKSDHGILQFNFHCYNDFAPVSSYPKRCYERGDFQKLRSQLDLDWAVVFSDVKEDPCTQWSRFLNHLNEAVDNCIPTMPPAASSRAKIPQESLKSFLVAKRKKSRSWQRFMENRDTNLRDEKWREYCKHRNKVRSMTRHFQKERERNVAMHAKVSPKLFWNYVNRKIKIKCGIPQLEVVDNVTGASSTTKNDYEKAEALLNHFSSVFVNEPPGAVPSAHPHQVDSALGDLSISVEMVLRKLDNLDVSKSPGPDKVHPRILKLLSGTLAKPLSIIFNATLRTGILPDDWKRAHVSAVFKKGEKKCPNNYRPISLTCIVCKVLESLIRDAIVDHMIRNDLFSPRQYGFIPGRSTSLQLLKMLDAVTNAIDNNNQVDIIYMDFMKAFDRVPHRRLIEKVKSYGIDGCILRWIDSFLSSRSHCVLVSGCASSWAPVVSGIPQGSVLGPTLFVLYVNDLPETTNCDTLLFADDTKVFNKISCGDDHLRLQQDLLSLQKWSDTWLLKFHPDKCKVLTIKSGPDNDDESGRVYYLEKDGSQCNLENVQHIKDLGVTIDCTLSFEGHFQNIISRANRMAGLIRRSFCHLDCNMFVRLYVAFVRPHLEYAHVVCNPHKQKYTDALEGVQRRATRFVPSLQGLSYKERLCKLRLPTLVYRRVRGDMIETFKVVKLYNKDVTPLFEFNTGITRGHPYKLNKFRAHKSTRHNFFMNRVINLWNSLPNHVVEADSVLHFEKALDKFWQNVEFKYDYRALPNDRLQPFPVGTFLQPGSGHRGLHGLRPEVIYK